MSRIINKLKSAELVELTDMQEVVLIHIVSYILRYNLEEKHLPVELHPYPDISLEPLECDPIEERFPDSLKLLNKVLALYAMSDKGD